MSVIRQICGQPLTEALSQADYVNMIMGVKDADLRKGLLALSKGQLKKIYAAINPSDPAAQGAGSDDDDDDDEKGGKKKDEPKKEPKKEPKDDSKKDDKKN